METASGRLVGVRELRQNLSVYLERVRQGETLTVTDRQNIVAVLAPASRDQDAIARLVAEGRATPGGRSHLSMPKPLALRLPRPLSALVRDLGEDTI
ncbi:MAG: type II toxin-antitoxin system Phd/YefM family antitoxin [Vicinamibacterales bacterium]